MHLMGDRCEGEGQTFPDINTGQVALSEEDFNMFHIFTMSLLAG